MAVTPDKIAVALGQATPAEGSALWDQWQMWIDDAEMLIESRAQKLGIPVGEIGQAKYDYVVREAVVAHVKRPDDATQVTVSIDDGSSSRSYQSGKGRVTILDEWWELLGLVDDTDQAFSIDMVPPAGAGHLPWCSLAFGALYCSCGVDIAGKPIFEKPS